MITVSLCMIVKNEETILKRCLDSLHGLMDEIIIIDTGSTDKTKEIARQYTDQVFDFTWTGSFADARNYSFSKATCDYIYTADADEVLDEENRQRFLQIKQAMLPEIEIVQMLYVNDLKQNTTYNFEKEYRAKLFKRCRNFTWIDPIHETVRLDPVVYDSDIEILHKPEGNHGNRDLLALERICEQGNRLSKKLHHMYAMELFITGNEQQFITACPFFERTMSEENRSLDEIKEAICVLVRGYRLQGKVEKFFQYALKDAVTTSSAEVCCELGMYYEERDDYEEAITWFLNAAQETESILDIHTSKEIPKKHLCNCYYKIGLVDEAKNWER